MTENHGSKTKDDTIFSYPVWVVEDDQQLNKVIIRSLKKAGFRCLSFFSGEQLLEYQRKQPHNNQKVIMLLDFLLEDMNAINLLEKLQNQNLYYPFVIMTGYGDEKTAVELMKMGAMDYVVKEKMFVNQIVKVITQVADKINTKIQLEKSQQEIQTSAEKLKLLNKQINMQKIELEAEKNKTDKLLQSILPKAIAKELLEKGYSKPREYDRVSILFADVISFSDLAKKSHPIELVTRLDNYFYVFDEIVEQFGLEKIKTIGDCYMCAGGIPDINLHNPVITVLAGLKIQQSALNLKVEYNSHLPEFRLRLGIHTGSVVAGVVGKNKFAYDIWGDAVNVASRIVEAGEKDMVNVSEKTYNLIKDYFVCIKRGEIITKKNYPIKMYFVERLKPQYSADKYGITPNQSLMKKININQGVRYY